MIFFLLSCAFTGSRNAPNNDGNKKAIKTRYDRFRSEVCHQPGTRQQAQLDSRQQMFRLQSELITTFLLFD